MEVASVGFIMQAENTSDRKVPEAVVEAGQGPEEFQSKNARKKAARLLRLKLSRRAKKEKIKAEKKSQGVKRSRDPLEAGPSKKQRRVLELEGLKKGLTYGQRIAIDFSYGSLMSEKELGHLASQVRRAYGANRVAAGTHKEAASLYLLNLPEDGHCFKVLCSKNDGFANYVAHRRAEGPGEVFSASEVVYLSPDAESPLLGPLSRHKVYVIGGLSDDSVKKHSSKNFAKSKSFECFRLPIQEFCRRRNEGSFSQVLTVNAVFQILLNCANNGGDWAMALNSAIPQRFGWEPVRDSPNANDNKQIDLPMSNNDM